MITLDHIKAAVNLANFDADAAHLRMAPARARTGKNANTRQAGVLILLYPEPDGLHIVLTRRTANLRGHSGQVSFPGGSRDPHDESFTATALRETGMRAFAIGAFSVAVRALRAADGWLSGSLDARALRVLGKALNFAQNTGEEELQRAKEAAEAASQAKGAFLTTVSHELRTPLTSVMGFAKLIKRRLREVIAPALAGGAPNVERALGQVTANVDIIVAEGERLTTLINDVLDLAKIESGRIEWHMEPISVPELVQRAQAATRALSEQKGLEVRSEIRVGPRSRALEVEALRIFEARTDAVLQQHVESPVRVRLGILVRKEQRS